MKSSRRVIVFQLDFFCSYKTVLDWKLVIWFMDLGRSETLWAHEQWEANEVEGKKNRIFLRLCFWGKTKTIKSKQALGLKIYLSAILLNLFFLLYKEVVFLGQSSQKQLMISCVTIFWALDKYISTRFLQDLPELHCHDGLVHLRDWS